MKTEFLQWTPIAECRFTYDKTYLVRAMINVNGLPSIDCFVGFINQYSNLMKGDGVYRGSDLYCYDYKDRVTHLLEYPTEEIINKSL